MFAVKLDLRLCFKVCIFIFRLCLFILRVLSISSLFVRLNEKSKSVLPLFSTVFFVAYLVVGTEHQGLCEESFRGVLVHSPVCCTWQRRGTYHTNCGLFYNKQFQSLSVVGNVSQLNVHYRLLGLGVA